jgi:hypothetical protein
LSLEDWVLIRKILFFAALKERFASFRQKICAGRYAFIVLVLLLSQIAQIDTISSSIPGAMLLTLRIAGAVITAVLAYYTMPSGGAVMREIIHEMLPLLREMLQLLREALPLLPEMLQLLREALPLLPEMLQLLREALPVLREVLRVLRILVARMPPPEPTEADHQV